MCMNRAQMITQTLGILPMLRRVSPLCQVKQRVYPAVDELLKRVTGATRTLIFDHTLRNGHIE